MAASKPHKVEVAVAEALGLDEKGVKKWYEDLKTFFKAFLEAETVEDIMESYRGLTETAAPFLRGKPLYKGLDMVQHRVAKQLHEFVDRKIKSCDAYSEKVCKKARVVIVGAGPGGLRAAVELCMLGADVTLLEGRTHMSRNNVLKLWPGVIEDMLSLGLKLFHPKFGTGANERCAIRRLQLTLLRAALGLGAKIRPGTSYTNLQESEEGVLIAIKNEQGDAETLEADMLVGADGEHSTVADNAKFHQETWTCSHAVGITFNFKYNKGKANEVRLNDIAKAYQFYSDWFQQLATECGVLLENLVYFKDETHYFVMSVKPEELIKSGIIREEKHEQHELLAPSNIDKDKFMQFAKAIALKAGLPDTCQFALNNRGNPDMGIFDFTKKQYRTEPVKILGTRKQRPLLVSLVGDSLIAPFWPLGTGANKAVLGAMDAGHYLSRFVDINAKNAPGSTEREKAFLTLCSEGRALLKALKGAGVGVAGGGEKVLQPNKRENKRKMSHMGPAPPPEYTWNVDPHTRYARLADPEDAQGASDCLVHNLAAIVASKSDDRTGCESQESDEVLAAAVAAQRNVHLRETASIKQFEKEAARFDSLGTAGKDRLRGKALFIKSAATMMAASKLRRATLKEEDEDEDRDDAELEQEQGNFAVSQGYEVPATVLASLRSVSTGAQSDIAKAPVEDSEDDDDYEVPDDVEHFLRQNRVSGYEDLLQKAVQVLVNDGVLAAEGLPQKFQPPPRAQKTEPP